MPLLLGLNSFDLILIIVLFIGLLIGFVRGVGPQAASLASIWFGLLIALYLYRPFSNYILQGLEWSSVLSDTLSFMAMLFVSFHTVRLIVRYLTKAPEDKVRPIKRKGRVGPVDPPKPTLFKRLVVGPVGTISSMLLGLLLTILWTAIVLGIMQFFFQTGAFEQGNAQPGLTGQLQSSALVPYFNRVLWLLVRSLSLFVLGVEGCNILETVVDTCNAQGEALLRHLIEWLG
ncbi:MAG TPA: CvpA family protein [Anaerolineae bacterium]|nr:CvpA family protein [Anaerolineae bacterium]HMR64329.1 CvpA family protein [Anaerolineae bacterium]